MSHVAVVLSQPGDVLVISGGDPVSALWGDMAGMAAKLRGVVGVILDGGVRDVADIREMNLPTWARTVSPAKPVKATPGSANVPIRAGGTMVEPGDVILADDDGVLVIPAADLEWVLERAEARAASEVEARKVMEAGDTETLYKKNKMDQILADAGVETIDDSYQSWKASQK
jgi:4-hydroxy-4-methyl-2-oxoglutarate aldolase